MTYKIFIPYLLVMALVTYLIRVIPLVLIRKKIAFLILMGIFCLAAPLNGLLIITVL